MEDERAAVVEELARKGLAAHPLVNASDAVGLSDAIRAAGVYVGIYDDDDDVLRTEAVAAAPAQVRRTVFARVTPDPSAWYARLQREFPDLRVVPFSDAEELRRLVPETVRAGIPAAPAQPAA